MTEIDLAAVSDSIDCNLKLSFDWSYGVGESKLADLYEKAKQTQWDESKQLAWETDVDPERPSRPEPLEPLFGSSIYEKLDQRERARLRAQVSGWSQSQFLHGEQGALLAASQLVVSLPHRDGKVYAASQVLDEARHVEVFRRYLQEKIKIIYEPSVPVRKLFEQILTDSRWDMKLLGMQILVEGLALAAFGLQRDMTQEPLLKSLTKYVILDEARHVAFGITCLKSHYTSLSETELAEREDFVFEGLRAMSDRFLFQEVWERVGLPVAECLDITRRSERQIAFRKRLFAKVVPAVARVGLLSARQRERFGTLGVLDFANEWDPFDDFDSADQELRALRSASDTTVSQHPRRESQQ